MLLMKKLVSGLKGDATRDVGSIQKAGDTCIEGHPY